MAKILSGILVVLGLALSGCALTSHIEAERLQADVTRQFFGSKSVPDTVIMQVMELKEAGILTDVHMTRSIPAQITATGPENVLACLASEGSRWLEEQQECEYMEEKTCTDLGGQFNACASACGDDPGMACVMMCVPVCSFPN